MANNPFDPPIVQVKKTLSRGGLGTVNRGFGSIAAPSTSRRVAPGPENLSELDDVDGSTLPQDGDTLFFDSESELWTPGEAFRPDLSTPPTYGQTLVWNGSAWIPGSSGGGGGGTAVYSPADLPRGGDLYYDPFTSLDPGWAVYNSGAGVSYDIGEFGLEGRIGGDSTQMRPLLRDTHPGNFRIETAIHELFMTDKYYFGAALLVTNSAATAARSLVAHFSTSNNPSYLQIADQTYSPLSNRGSNTGFRPTSPSAPLYFALNVYDDGGWKTDLEWSRTGQFWQRLSSASSLTFTPGKVGISMYDRTGDGGQALFKWFRVRSL